MIQFRSVTKRYARQRSLRALLRPRDAVVALNDVSFAYERGDVVGIMGPNGAGKTTTLKLIANLLLPDHGEIVIGGEQLGSRSHALRNKIGFVTCDERSFIWRLSGRQNLEFFGALNSRYAANHMRELAERFDLARDLDRPFSDYSTGMRKRLAIIRGLMCRPDVVLFDEATNGLDPMSVAELKRLVQEQRRNITIVWTTHRLDEIAVLCSRVLVIAAGGVLFDGSVADLKRKFAPELPRVAIEVRGEAPRLKARLRAEFAVEREAEDGDFTATVVLGHAGARARVLTIVEECAAELRRFEEVEASLDGIYRALVNEDHRRRPAQRVVADPGAAPLHAAAEAE